MDYVQILHKIVNDKDRINIMREDTSEESDSSSEGRNSFLDMDGEINVIADSNTDCCCETQVSSLIILKIGKC